VGWKPLTDVKDLFDNIPCLKPLTQGAPGLPNWNRDTLKYMVRKFLKLDDQQVKDLFKGLCEATDKEWGYQRTGRDLLQRLGKQYDRTDPGNLVAVICMNFMTLTRGESIHIPADDVHAYLHGECVECMATSDNVVNTGFAPPEDRDPDLFCESANWISKSPGDWVIRPDRSTKGKLKHTRVYAPPHLSEFNMLMTRLRNGAAEDLAGINGPTIMFVTNGQGMLKSKDQSLVLKEGYVFFVEPNTPFEVKAEEGTDMELHMAYCEGDMS
jgi:mannose-6-phosphate isomerase